MSLEEMRLELRKKFEDLKANASFTVNPDGEVRITRAERLGIPVDLYVEPVIVCIEAREIERCWDHFSSDTAKFENLISQKKLAGYKVSAKDAVFAYLLIFGHGSRHLIAGFLSTFPEWSTITASTVGEALSRLKAEGWTI